MEPETLNWLAPLVVAPFVGSFAGVLVQRLPRGQPIGMARSMCGHCRAVLGWRDLVPLASFALAGGRCRHCGAPIGMFHPAIELAALGIAAVAVWLAGDGSAWPECMLGWTLLTLAWIDAEHMILPDVLTLPLLLAGLALAWSDGTEWFLEAAAGAALGWIGFSLLASGYRRIRGRNGLGAGDAKLLGTGGAWCGLASLPAIVLLAAVLALLVLVPLRLVRGDALADARVPFGPWLALAIWVVFLMR